MLVDNRRDYGEVRIIAIGLIDQRVHVCVYTLRGERKRIISLRRAHGEKSMPIVRPSKTQIEPARRATKRARLDTMTDADIARQIEENPDTAPDVSDALRARRKTLLPDVDVKRVRARLGLSQSQFAARFRIPLRTLQDWEQKRYAPDQTAATYLHVIERDPQAVEYALKR
jgi:putative transcriptional regulator